MRLIGSIAVLMLCVLIGKSKASALDMRYRIMHALALDLRTLAAEMEYRPRDIRDMAKGLYAGDVGEFWAKLMLNIEEVSGAEKAWENTVKTYSAFDALSPQETALITEVGKALWTMNAENSAKVLKYWSEQMEKCAEDLKEQSKSKGAVYQKLGLFGGLAAMLLVI